LHDSGEVEFIARSRKASEPHPFKAVMNLQIGKSHLDTFALVAWFKEGLRSHQAASQVAGNLMDITRDPSCRHIGATLHFERTEVAIELGGAISKHIAIVHPASGVQHLIVGANVNALPPVPAKVTPWESTVVTLAGIANWDVRGDPTVNQPAKEAATPASGVSGKPLRLQIEPPLGTIEHCLCWFYLIEISRKLVGV
jgi:hypothetical protein